MMKNGMIAGILVMMLGVVMAVHESHREHKTKVGPLTITEESSSSIHPGWGIAVGLAGFALFGYCLTKTKD